MSDDRNQCPPTEPTSDQSTEHGDDRARTDAADTATADELSAAVEELDDRWRRAMAELDNQRKRHARELRHAREVERAHVATAWLPVVDNLELAISHAESDPNSVVEGVRAVRDQAVQILRDLGYPRHDETGVPFDPTRHEVVSVVDDTDTAPGTVVQVLRPGYGEPERQLRPAAVVVSRKQE
ncbi:nucleotide exchange factor GrpE [Streptantibioticus ferralitis]|uniref:Protein GrpE n=1 Tax=Streptantibioticus ferralitis TaxID=236510 RepID=A0ABT5Z3R9_9ACTN|nr:nucleotide exchange factor GrpE [Streptantibioticus ferralitis]MDF2258453.1 nucleotide exchange factor GrpE [Streptantibioticus ferralitis]